MHKEYESKSKGEFQHRIFKFIILIFVFIFVCLIFGFIYIEFFGSEVENNSPKNFYKINSKIYDILSSIDNTFYSKEDFKIEECNKDTFYNKNIIEGIPCIIKNERNESPENMINFVNKILKFDQRIKGKEFKLNINNPYSDNFPKFIYVYNTEIKKEIFHFRMSPISQIKMLNPLRNDTSQFFNILYSQLNFFDENEKKDLILIEATINSGDILFIPAYFFYQCKENKCNDKIDIFQYKESNKLSNFIFKALFNDFQK